MKPYSHSFLLPRRALAATTLILAGALTASAQNSGSSSYGSGANADSQPNATTTTDTTTTSGMATDHTTNSAGKLSWSDKRFVTKAADGNQDEVAIAQLATERASSPEVKQFAQKLVDDHTQMGSALTSLAQSKDVKLDNDKSKDRTYKRLSNKSGDEFDREFVANMVDEHEKDIKMFEKAANDAKDTDVRSFASSQLDHLRDHLQMAQNLQQSIVPTGRASKNSGRPDTTTTTTNNSGTTTTGSGQK